MLGNALAITTSSLGLHPSHSLPEKIHAAASANFSAIEIVYQELEDYALSQTPILSIRDAAHVIEEICASANVAVLALNPFKNFEGHDSPLEDRLHSARKWLDIAACLGAKYLQVPSQFDTSNSSGDWPRMVAELRQLADIAASYSIGIVYEAVAWGSYVNTWEDSLRMVQDVDRKNFGLCLDSFHIAARLWGDNTVASGVREDAGTNLQISLDRFVETCPLDKILYVQISDGEKFDPPLTTQHRFDRGGFPPALSWSRNMRPFPLDKEQGAYFPIVTIADALLKRKGWKGPVSIETFDWRTREDESRRPHDTAKRGMESIRRLAAALGNEDC